MPFALLLAMQAAGMVVDYLGTSYQAELGKYGQQLQEAGINANIEQTRLQAEDESLNNLIALRKNLGTQLAIFGARGTNPGQGSAFSILQESIGNFNSDERMRRMNLLGNINKLKTGGLISRLNQQGETSKLWQGFASRTINRFPGGTGGNVFGASSFSGAKAGASYGMTPIGG